MSIWTSLIAPAVVAAVISLIGVAISVRTTRAIHRERLEAEHQLAERRLRADIDLAEKKFRLDRALADWKRRTDLAEQVLADFYKAGDLFSSARSPLALEGEGRSRKRQNTETEDEAQQRDAIYAPFERLLKHLDFFSELHARRYRFRALFGPDSIKPFQALLAAYNDVALATRILVAGRRTTLTVEQLNKYEATIGWGLDDEDAIKKAIDQAISDMEAICRPVLETPPA
jgi:hypothetical protein